MVCEMDKSWMHADRRSKAYELGTTYTLMELTKAIRFGYGMENLGNGLLLPVEMWKKMSKAGMDDNDLGDIGFDPYEFANVIGDGDQPLYPVAVRMSYEKIHTCPNDCILYRKDYEDSTNCPTCGVSRWKEGKDAILKEGVPAKVKWLPINHPYRRQRAAFNGKPEYGTPPEPLNGEEVLRIVEDINYIWGSKNGGSVGENDGDRVCWKKKSKFFDLEYWKYLHVRHVLDVMHIEKNVCDSIIGTLLEIPGKNKDGIAARLDLLNMGVKTDLQPKYGERRTRLPPGPWNLSRAEKRAVCNSFYGMKVPEDSRLLGLKSHDCHLDATILPMAIRSVLEKPARYMKVLKGYVQNRARPEGCIAERWSAFKPEDGSFEAIIREHMIHIKTTYPKFRKRTKWLQDKHNSTFIQWLHFKVQSELNGEEHNGVLENLRWLAAGPSMAVPSYRSYLINEIWDLDYHKFRIPVLRCDWVDNTSGLVVDELGFTLIDLSKIGHRNDQFVMASQVKQVFYVDDPMHRGWSVVLSMPNREYNDVIGDDVLGDTRIECEPFTRRIPNVDTFDDLVGEFGNENIRARCEDIWID
ncbi:hypothetical protein Prudu_602S000400 [Prunus dulcis]|uniref:DUF4216 domain-containing protein n=1 Tax=Prunus dulcis TaxID=3755 RepID=A0A5H2XPU9_PRUDU|nr:hypothetical protein Prudu_602S000400 [Prunus dulcis]